MGKLEKSLLFVLLFLLICILVVLALPDRAGKTGFQALVPVVDEAGQAFGRAFNSLRAEAAQWSRSMLGEARKNVSPSAGNKDQGNPIDSAISPLQSYGEEQKNLFNKTLP
jgi:hypothetical protein